MKIKLLPRVGLNPEWWPFRGAPVIGVVVVVAVVVGGVVPIDSYSFLLIPI